MCSFNHKQGASTCTHRPTRRDRGLVYGVKPWEFEERAALDALLADPDGHSPSYSEVGDDEEEEDEEEPEPQPQPPPQGEGPGAAGGGQQPLPPQPSH